jgi:hypothetical protein
VRSVRSIGVTVLLLLAAVTAAAAGPLEGRWHLVHESYGKGKGNLAGEHRPVDLEFKRVGGELSGAMRTDEVRPFVSWPFAPADRSADAIRVVERAVAAEEDRVRVRYVIEPRPGDDLALDIVEEYRVVEEGRALVGRVTVAFVDDGEPRGSYELHRRFERLP